MHEVWVDRKCSAGWLTPAVVASPGAHGLRRPWAARDAEVVAETARDVVDPSVDVDLLALPPGLLQRLS